MIKRKFGWTYVDVYVICQGPWLIDDDVDSRAIETQMGLDLGMTHIDTAEMYRDGKAEELVGQVISGRKREDIFLANKVLPSNASFEGTIKS